MGSAMCVAAMFCFKGTQRVRGFGLFQSITNTVSAFGPALGGTYNPGWGWVGVLGELLGGYVQIAMVIQI